MYWTTREGKKLKISEMETSHIQNCMKMIRRKFPAMFICEDMVDEFDAIPPSYVRCVYDYMKEEYKERFCDLDNASKAMCLAMFAIEYKLGHCNKKYIAEQFKKLDNDTKKDYVFLAQRLCNNFWKCLPSKDD